MRTPKGNPNGITSVINGLTWERTHGERLWQAEHNDLLLFIESPRSGYYVWSVYRDDDNEQALRIGQVYADSYWKAADQVKDFLKELLEENTADDAVGETVTPDLKEN